MKCPDCDRDMVWMAKDTSTGREICDYYCSACGLIAVVDDGVAWWKVITSSPGESDAGDVAGPDDGPRILRIKRLDDAEREEMNAFIRLRSGEAEPSAGARKARKRAGRTDRRSAKAGGPKSPAGLATLIAIFAIIGLLFAAILTGNLNGYVALAALRSLAHAVVFRP